MFFGSGNLYANKNFNVTRRTNIKYRFVRVNHDYLLLE